VTFRGALEREPSLSEAPIVGELRDSDRGTNLALEQDKLIARIVVGYEDEEGGALGIAPPPAGIARLAPRASDAPAPSPDAPTDEPSTEPPKGTKPTKPTKPTKGTKGTKGARPYPPPKHDKGEK
jgi:hypothetical protein